MYINSWDRALLCSAKPALYTNVDSTPLIAAIVSRQASVVKYLLEVINFVMMTLNLIEMLKLLFKIILHCNFCEIIN